MKKLTAVSLTLVLACALAGCGADRLTSSVAPPSAAVPSSSAPQESSSAPASSSEKIDSAALLGEWSGNNVYTNEALGLRYVLPEGWVYASEEELLNLLGIVMDSELVDDRTKLALKLDESRVIYAMAAQDPAVGNNVQIVAEDLGSVVGGSMVDEAAYADIVADQQLKSTDTVTYTVGETYTTQLGGLDFLVLPVTTETSGVRAQQLMCLRKVGGRMLLVTVTTVDGTAPDTLEGGLSSFSAL